MMLRENLVLAYGVTVGAFKACEYCRGHNCQPSKETKGEMNAVDHL